LLTPKVKLNLENETATLTNIEVEDSIMQALISKSASVFLACDSEVVRKKYIDYVKRTAGIKEVLHFSLQETGIQAIIEQLNHQSDNKLDQLGIDLENITNIDRNNRIKLPELDFEPDKKKFIVIIEQLEKLKTNAEIITLQMALKIWTNYTFIMLGNKMQTVLSGTVEYRVDR
jgi:hypothetical protein